MPGEAVASSGIAARADDTHGGEVLARLHEARPVWWNAPPSLDAATVEGEALHAGLDAAMDEAVERLARLRPALLRLFPPLAQEPEGGAEGRIEAPLVDAPGLARALDLPASGGRLLVQCDHLLPVAGSVKARGGLHEVLMHAEALAAAHGLPVAGDAIAGEAARALFARHVVAVGSTGNLGLAIGVGAAALGFRAVVHMSAEAKAWKKARLRARGVEVVEHAGDYGLAVAAGRAASAADPSSHFVDDENSRALFAGYAACADAFAARLAALGVRVDAAHPLVVHLPCGVGGAPGGIAHGLARRLGPHVHAFLAEPVQSPCVLLRLLAAPGSALAREGGPSVHDAGLGRATEADGLAVPRASVLATDAMHGRVRGVYTVDDDTLLRDLALAHDAQGLRIEPSAAAGIDGARRFHGAGGGREALRRRGVPEDAIDRATQVVWTTGGRFVPEDGFADFLARGRALRASLG